MQGSIRSHGNLKAGISCIACRNLVHGPLFICQAMILVKQLPLPVRGPMGTMGNMIDPQMRAFTTEHGKKMCLYPKTILFSGGAADETLQIQLNQLNYMLIESTRAIQLVAKWNIDISAPIVSLQFLHQAIQTSRSVIQAEAKVGLIIIPKGTGWKSHRRWIRL